MKIFTKQLRKKHITLDQDTITKKIQRIYDGLQALGNYAFACPSTRLKPDWIKKDYKECIIEDFHFAFNVYKDEDNILFVYVHDVCHSLLYK